MAIVQYPRDAQELSKQQGMDKEMLRELDMVDSATHAFCCGLVCRNTKNKVITLDYMTLDRTTTLVQQTLFWEKYTVKDFLILC